jgi:adenylate cyclase
LGFLFGVGLDPVSWKAHLRKSWAASVIGAALAVGVGICLLEFAFGYGLSNWSYDLLQVAQPHIPANEAVIVYLDEESHEKLQQPKNKSWDRRLHAQLIQCLMAAGAKAVVFDIVFSDANPESPEGDQRLAQALHDSGKVVLAADHVQLTGGGNTINPPTDLLRTNAVDMGSAEVVPSRDLVVRLHTPNDPIPSLSWAAAHLVGAQVTQQEDSGAVTRWINYYGPAKFVPGISYFQALQPEVLDGDFFRGKTAFVGAHILTKFAGERKDQYLTPFSYWQSKGGTQDPFIDGVEIQATMFLNLLRGEWLVRPPGAVEHSILIACGILFGAGLIRLRAVAATAVAILSAAAVAGAAYLWFVQHRVWFPWLIVVVQIALALSWSIIFNSIQLYVQKKLYEQTIRLYLSPKLVKKFSSNPKFLQPGAEKQTLTVVFTDIANFTSISEGMDSDELARAMNRYFQEAVANCIHPTDGTVVKYIGDAIFAFWNAPDAQADHQLRACQAALNFSKQKPMQMNGQALITRIGLHTGVANVGNFGSTERVDYTALGENINLASRMEGLNKYLGTTVLATGDAYLAVSDQITARFAGRFRLKGFEKAVDVYELVCTHDQAEVSRPWREAFAQALKHFRQKDFAGAEAGFRRTLELHAEDGPAKFYLARIAELRTAPVPDDWSGEIELKEK